MSAEKISRIALLTAVLALGACGGGGGGTPTPPDPGPSADHMPDAITFAAPGSLLPATAATSNAVKISGLSEPVPASISAGGEISVNGGTWTSDAVTVRNGDTLRVRGIAGQTPDTLVTLTLTVGDGSATFAIPTAPAGTVADTRPDPFNLPDPDAANVEPGGSVTTAPVIVSGVNTGVPVSVSAGAGLLIDGEPVEGDTVVAFPGQSIQVTVPAPVASNGVSEAVLTIGDTSEIITVITPPAEGEVDAVPELFPAGIEIVSGDPAAAEPGSFVVMGPIPVTGIAAAVPVTISNGEFSLTGDEPWHGSQSTDQTVTDGSSVFVRIPASAFPATRTEAILSVGGVSKTFGVTTRAVPAGSDTEPDAFAFEPETGVAPGSIVLSNIVTVTGIDAPAAVNIQNGAYRINGGQFMTTAGTVVAGQTLQVRLAASSETETETVATLTVGNVVAPFSVNTGNAPNQSPVANAGIDQSVSEGVVVNLNGSGADPDGDAGALTFAWTQTAGPAVTLVGAATRNPHFDAIDVEADTTFTFALTVTDAAGASSEPDTVDVTIANVAPGNTIPVANAGPDQAVAEGEGVTVTLDGTASNDADGNTLTFNWQAPEGITLSSTSVANPTFIVPDVVADTPLTFTLTVDDGNGGVATDTVTITVQFVNQFPVANAGDDQTVAEGDDVTVTLDGSASNDADGNALTFNWQAPEGITLSSPTAVQPTFLVPDITNDTPLTFTLTVEDGKGGVVTDTVTVTVQFVNQAPVANADNSGTPEDTAKFISWDGLLANDSDGDGHRLEVTGVSNPVNGTVTTQTNGLLFTPAADFNGTASIDYSISDGNQGSDTGTVAITVTPVNDRPVTMPDHATVAEDGSVTIDVLANDFDVEGDALHTTNRFPAAHGSYDANADGSLTYTPDPDFSGTDTFRYRASDGASSGVTAEVTIEVIAENDAPIPVNDEYDIDEDQELIVGAVLGVLVNDTDPDNALSAQLVSSTANGTLALNADGSFIYTPFEEFSGTDSFTYQAVEADGDERSAPVQVTITVNAVSDIPLATVDSYQVVEDLVLNIDTDGGVLANDTDPDNDLIAELVSGASNGPFNGTVTLTTDGGFTYTPNPEFSGTDSFTYQAVEADGDQASATTQVTIVVSPSNDQPVAVVDAYNATEDTVLTVGADLGLLANDTDPDNGLRAELVSGASNGPFNGTVELSADGAFTYTPGDEFSGTDSFVYQAVEADGEQSSAPATVTITVVPANDAPAVAVTGPVTTILENGDPATVTFSGDVSDIDGDTAETMEFSWHADAFVDAGGGFTASGSMPPVLTVTKLPDVASDTVFTFTLKATDDGGLTGEGSATLNVTFVNTAPVAVATVNFNPLAAGATGQLDGSGSSDVEGQPLEYIWTLLSEGDSVPLNLTDPAKPTFTAPDTAQQLLFQLVVRDGIDSSQPVTVNVAIDDTNSSPVIGGTTTTPTTPIDEGAAVSLSVNASDADVTGVEGSDVLSYDWIQTGGLGVSNLVVDSASGAATFTAPQVLESGGTENLGFEVTVTDSKGATATESVTIAVNNVNQPPVIVSVTASPDPVIQGEGLTLSAEATDADVNDQLTFHWAHGEESVEGAIAVVAAPSVSEDTDVHYTLTVTDAAGDTDVQDVLVSVEANRPPVAVASVNPADVFEGEQGGLDASGSLDADGDTITYEWSITGPQDVTLLDADKAVATFDTSALDVTVTETYTAMVRVADPSGETDSSTVTFDVHPNEAPEFSVQFPPERSIAPGSEGQLMTVRGVSMDLDTAIYAGAKVTVENRLTGESIEQPIAFDEATGMTDWMVEMPLGAGLNEIDVIVQDGLGAQAVKKTVTVDTVSEQNGSGSAIDVRGYNAITYDSSEQRIIAASYINKDEIVSIDVANGDRAVISDATVGNGVMFDGIWSVGIDIARNRAIALDQENDSLMSVDLSSGDRAILKADDGSSIPSAQMPYTNSLADLEFVEGGRHLFILANVDGIRFSGVDMVAGNHLFEYDLEELDFIRLDAGAQKQSGEHYLLGERFATNQGPTLNVLDTATGTITDLMDMTNRYDVLRVDPTDNDQLYGIVSHRGLYHIDTESRSEVAISAREPDGVTKGDGPLWARLHAALARDVERHVLYVSGESYPSPFTEYGIYAIDEISGDRVILSK